MATEHSTEDGATEEMSTPIKVVLVGAGLTILESVFDMVFAELYAGEFDGVVVTETEIIIVTAIGLLFALGILWYAYSVRYAPTKKAYLVIGGLAILSFLIGWLFSNVITLIGALIGYWELRK